jgi:predicted alpha/beta superfamily hydrolase
MKNMIENKTTVFKGIHTGISVVGLLFILNSCEKEVFEPTLTHEFTIQSTSNGANYDIKVGLPADYNPEGKNYASIYVLDGEEIFDFVSNKCQEISNELAVANAVVISIGYGKDRSIDYTPTVVSSITGGGPQFLDFIEKQLIPVIEENISVDTARSSRVILGHSYGGLFGAYAFSMGNRLFGNYILLSPSLWFDNLIALQFEKDKRVENKDSLQLVFMGIGGAENIGRMQAPFEAFYQILQDNYTNIRLQKNVEGNLAHMGSRHPNIIKGLNYYFQNR